MARFARDILIQMSVETKKLESTLGADTAKLNLRIGIHSGPVTAGVLRGDRARFQVRFLKPLSQMCDFAYYKGKAANGFLVCCLNSFSATR